MGTRLVNVGLLVLPLLVGPPSVQASPAATSEAKSGGDLSRGALRLLEAECFGCHNPEKKKGGLVLTSRAAVLKGNDDGAVVVPGDPRTSKLLRALEKDADPHMPPKGQLSSADIALVSRWIQAGLPWDATVLAGNEGAKAVSLAPLPAAYQPVLALALSSDNRRLAVSRGGEIFIYDFSARKEFPVLARFPAHTDAVQALAWSRDDRWLASSGFRRVLLWDGRSYGLHRECTNQLVGLVTAMGFSPDGTHLLVGDSLVTQSGVLREFEVTGGSPLHSWRAHSDSICALDFSRDGQRLVTAGGDKLVKLWNLKTREEITQLEGHGAQVQAVAFDSFDGQVVSGGADKLLVVWDVAARERIMTLGNSMSAITALAWPPAGGSLFAASDHGTVLGYSKIRRPPGRQVRGGEERKIGEIEEAIISLLATSDGQTVVAGAQDGSVYVWTKEGDLLARLKPEAPPETMSKTVTSVVAAMAAAPSIHGLLSKQPQKAVKTISAPSPAGAIVALKIEPATINLSGDSRQHGVLVSAITADGQEFDVTDEARLSTGRQAPFVILPAGGIRAMSPGQGTLTAHFRGKKAQAMVRVGGLDSNGDGDLGALKSSPVSFLRDVLPVLSRAGCNAGACHAKPEGQNGFKLSVFSYDPKLDYAEIVKDGHGRRVFPAAPAESLIIRKPTAALSHEGGRRFEPGSEAYELLLRWLREGMTYAVPGEPTLERIEVFPKERLYRGGSQQRLLVQAHYSDGSMRDVTGLALFAESDREFAKVEEGAMLSIGRTAGKAVVVARYMGLVADSQILIPAEHGAPESDFVGLPENNFIDRIAYAQFKRLGLFPSDLCTDAEFLRRARLDAVGQLPRVDEVRAFLADAAPDKRGQLIARVLQDPAYADYWANKWADLLRPNPDRVGVKSVWVLDQWLRESFRQNKPYDQFVREIVQAEGSNHRDGPAVIYRDRREPPQLTTMFSQLFLGVRLECAKCHHHPNEKWSQDDFYQFAAFFGPIKQKGAGIAPPISPGAETFFFQPGGEVKHPVNGQVMHPRPLDGKAASTDAKMDPRRSLADWMTGPDNPFFARAAVNRVWAVFFGRGLVEPVDDLRISNPCVNPELLAALASDFARQGYDLKHLMRTIMQSRLYQLSSTPNERNLADTRQFTRSYRRRLPAEVLLDAVDDVTGIPDTFAAAPAGSRATQVWSYKVESQFMDAFGRPNKSSDCPCERDRDLSVVQSLHLMNSKALQEKLSNAEGRPHQLAQSSLTPREIVDEAYLVTFGRLPHAEESEAAGAAFTLAGATRQTATEDLFWALLNSPEFLLNH